MKTVTIVSDDRVGLLADISYVLGKSSVNIEGLFVDVVGGKAIISIEVKDYKKASEILGSNGFKTANSEAIIIKVANDHVDKIGEMLEGEKVQIKNLSRISFDSRDGVFALEVDKPRKATKLLSPVILGSSPTNDYY